jgi:2-polyprenyl-3-methyl-5-hydroxy-6-metoxy-1,4-benzoquinol methylase
MTISKLVARQLSNPTGILAGIATFVWNRRNAALNDMVLNLLSLQPIDRVLDVGFGGGYLLERMSTIVTESSQIFHESMQHQLHLLLARC